MRTGRTNCRLILLGIAVFTALGTTAAASDLRSHAHPALTTPPSSLTIDPWSRPMGPRGRPSLPLSLVQSDAAWTHYSRAVNALCCFAEGKEETWLGTRLGIKRIDEKAGRVRHYTRLEGLPGDEVVAIAADGDSAWCLVTVRPEPSAASGWAVALCEYRRGEDRWEERGRLPLPGNPFTLSTPGGPPADSPRKSLQRSALAVTASQVAVAPDAEGAPLLLLYDRRRGRLEPVSGAPPGARESTFLHADSKGIWLGTDIGLLHCRPAPEEKPPTWQRHPTGGAVLAGVHDGEQFWFAVAAETKPDAPLPWQLSRFTPRTATLQSFTPTESPLSRRTTGRSPYAASIGRGSDGGVWIAINLPFVSSYRELYRFAPDTQAWRVYRGSNIPLPEEAPAAALTLPQAARRIMAPFLMFPFLDSSDIARRHPEWFCPNEAIAEVDANRASSTATGTPGGDGGRVWTHRDERGRTPAEAIGEPIPPLPRINLPRRPPVRAVAAQGTTLFVALPEGVWVGSAEGGDWRKASLPLRDNTNTRLVPWKGQVYAGSDSGGLYRYVPETDEFAVLWGGGGLLPLLGLHPSGDAWLHDLMGRLRRIEPNGEETPVLSPTLPPALRVEENQNLRPLSAAGGFLWYAGRVRGQNGESAAILGYDPDRYLWTPPLFRPQLPNRLSSLAVEGVIYLTDDDAGGVQSYDPEARRWQAVAPPPTPTRSLFPTLAAADAGAVWLLDHQQVRLWRFDRKSGAWSSFACPVQRGGGVPYVTDAVARQGDTLFVASNQGLWRFRIPTVAWEPQPLPGPQSFLPYRAVATEAALWFLLRDGESEQTVAARYDRAQRRWTVWGSESGFPDGGAPDRLTVVGEAAWVVADGRLYHLVAATARWEEVTARLAEAAPDRLYVRDLIADGRFVWLLSALRPAADPGETPAAAPPLTRYDTQTGVYQRFMPPGDRPDGRGGSATAMLVEPDAVWITMGREAFRFDKAALTWQPVRPSAGLLPTTFRIVRRAGALWFLGVDEVSRWKER